MGKLYLDKRQPCQRNGKRRTNSQWRAIGWNYHRVLPFDMWCDIGCPEPPPRVYGLTREEERELYD